MCASWRVSRTGGGAAADQSTSCSKVAERIVGDKWRTLTMEDVVEVLRHDRLAFVDDAVANLFEARDLVARFLEVHLECDGDQTRADCSYAGRSLVGRRAVVWSNAGAVQGINSGTLWLRICGIQNAVSMADMWACYGLEGMHAARRGGETEVRVRLHVGVALPTGGKSKAPARPEGATAWRMRTTRRRAFGTADCHEMQRLEQSILDCFIGTASDSARQSQHEENQEQQSENSARVIPPAAAVRPSGDDSEQQQYEHDNENCRHS